MERTIISFDYAIKTVLRDKANFSILSGFLSELLGKKVTVTGILESEGNRESKGAKTNRVDLKAKIDGGEIAIFEIQFADQVDFLEKILYDACKAVVEQVSAGSKYNIKKVYSINIAYFDLGARREYVFTAKITGFKGVNSKETIPFSRRKELKPPPADGSSIHPEYYLILPNKFGETIKTKFDEWVYVLKNSTVKSDFTAAGIKKAGQKLDRLNMTPAERAAYENYLKDRASVDIAIETARMKGLAKGREEGRAEGHAKGHAEGHAKGHAEGRAKGHAEGFSAGEKKAKIQMAKKLKLLGIPVEQISAATELTKNDIARL